jgi:hypothetical protein
MLHCRRLRLRLHLPKQLHLLPLQLLLKQLLLVEQLLLLLLQPLLLTLQELLLLQPVMRPSICPPNCINNRITWCQHAQPHRRLHVRSL